MTNNEILNLYFTLKKISQSDDFKFDAVTSFKLAKNKRALAPIYDSIMEARASIFKKHGTPDENGSYFIPAEKVNNFYKEYDELLALDISIILESISLDSLKDNQFTIQDIECLTPIIEKK